MAKLLLVEDDNFLRNTLKAFLKRENYTVEAIESGREALGRLEFETYDVVILDWGLPDIPGVEVVREYRDRGGMAPVLMLTGKNHPTEKVVGLDSGADDYLTKPFENVELAARIRALMRRPAASLKSKIEIGNVSLDTSTGIVKVNDANCELYPKEFLLLELLMKNQNKVMSAQAILESIWSSEQSSTSDVIRPYITRIRQKLADAGANIQIVTRKGFGYVLEYEVK